MIQKLFIFDTKFMHVSRKRKQINIFGGQFYKTGSAEIYRQT
jgi:hypothetical protein